MISATCLPSNLTANRKPGLSGRKMSISAAEKLGKAHTIRYTLQLFNVMLPSEG